MLRATGSVTPPYAVEPEIEGFEALIGEAGGPVRVFRFSCGDVPALFDLFPGGSRFESG